MASFFNLTLDTTAPGNVTVTINNGEAKTSDKLVNLTITTSDSPTTGYQMRIWGVAGAETESDAVWETFSTSKQVSLTNGDGVKTVYVKIRDDVLNESAQVSDKIILDASVPIVSIAGPDYSKISKVSGRNTATITFSSDKDFVEYKVCVVASASAAHGTGIIILTDNGSTNTSGTGTFDAFTEITAKITGADLETASPGDGVKIIKVFVKNDLGTWSA